VSDARPDPDALLKAVQALETPRARLLIYFGFAPGVGKTYAMLQRAHRLRDQGVEVVVGVLETHGRPETAALLDGLEVVPLRTVEHRGVKLCEFDLEAAKRQRPQVLLVDELAHTNAPGSLHPKRWQDVMDLLDAGIEVHTTLNVQHVESLNDAVAQITGVRVRETVPDRVLDRADALLLVDLPPESLLQRLREGHIYGQDQADRAAQSFFRRGNLLALRELALRRTAERVEDDVQAYREAHAISRPWQTRERIIVCVSPSPGAPRLLRAARRIADGLDAPWVAVWVEPPSRPLTSADLARLEQHLALAESLGAQVARLRGGPVAQTLLRFAREREATRVLLGKPTHARLWDRLRGSLLDEVVRGSGQMDVLVVSGQEERGEDDAPKPRAPAEPPRWASYGEALGLVALVTAAAAALHHGAGVPDVEMLYLLMLMGVAARGGHGPAVWAAALSVAAYDFFFVPPYLTFAVADVRYLLTFGMMFLVGLLMSALMARLRRQEALALAREARTANLYALSRALGAALDPAQAAALLAKLGGELLGVAATVSYPQEGGELVHEGDPLSPADLAVVRWAWEHRRPAGALTDTLPAARVRACPIAQGERPLGVLTLAPKHDASLGVLDPDNLDATLQQGALCLGRALWSQEARAAALRAKAEEIRSALLSSVSHDLRTPLATITGSATMLRDSPDALGAQQRAELLEGICDEAERLERLVANLLDATRLSGLDVRLRRAWVPLDEVVGGVLRRLERRLEGRPVELLLPPDLPLLWVDPTLLDQALSNLLENAARHTPPGSPITLRAWAEPSRLAVEVADRGPGLPPGAEGRVFEKFYRGPLGGTGLGLAICKGVAEAHAGAIEAKARDGGGASFVLWLPRHAPPDTPPGPSEP
jgi:two-component system sensor histidine kinase KdpD